MSLWIHCSSNKSPAIDIIKNLANLRLSNSKIYYYPKFGPAHFLDFPGNDRADVVSSGRESVRQFKLEQFIIVMVLLLMLF